MYKVVLKKSAQKELDRLPKNIWQRVALAVEDLRVNSPRSVHTKKLRDPLSGFRKRVGQYRILFDVHKNITLIHRIKKRDKAY